MSFNQFTPSEDQATFQQYELKSVRECDGGAIRLFNAVRRGGAWRTSRAQDAKRVFDRSRRFEPAQQGAIRCDGFHVRHQRDA